LRNLQRCLPNHAECDGDGRYYCEYT